MDKQAGALFRQKKKLITVWIKKQEKHLVESI